MRHQLTRGRCGPIGLDVGAGGVRMLQLVRTGGKLAAVAAGSWRVAPTASGAEPDAAAVLSQAVEAVDEMLRAGRFRGREVVSCLRTGALAIKNIRLPHMSGRELAGAILWEASDRLGFEVAADRLHYINAGEVRHGTEVRDEVLLMGAREQGVTDHLEMLSRMRLSPVHIDAEPAALFRAYGRMLRRAEDESTVTVIVDVGLSTTKVVVARGHTIVLIKLIDIAGRTLTESVAGELGLSYAEAAHIRRIQPAGGADAGGKVDWSVRDAMRVPAEALAREVGLCLRYCAVTFRGLRCRRVTLTGGEAYDKTLAELFAEHLNCECVIGEPLCGIDLAGVDLSSDRRGLLTEWSVAAGLAIRGLWEKTGPGKLANERSRVLA